MTTWITQVQAAEVLGVALSTVPKLVAAGELHPRGVAKRDPSLRAEEVQALARVREQRRTEAEARRRPRPDPRPDTDHEWLSMREVAQLLGLTRPGVMRRIHSGRLPATENRGRYWVRADHLELVERAHLAQRLRPT